MEQTISAEILAEEEREVDLSTRIALRQAGFVPMPTGNGLWSYCRPQPTKDAPSARIRLAFGEDGSEWPSLHEPATAVWESDEFGHATECPITHWDLALRGFSRQA